MAPKLQGYICKCCLSTGDHKFLWSGYIYEGEVEVYGEMMKECFAFPWTESEEHLEKICNTCVDRLRMSLAFRKEILASQKEIGRLLKEAVDYSDEGEINIKTEIEVKQEEVQIEYVDTEHEHAEDEEVLQDEADSEIGEETTEEQGTDDGTEYLLWEMTESEQTVEPEMEVEYLEDDKDATIAVERSKERAGLGKVHKYKQYTQRQLEEAIKAVNDDVMTISKAAEHFSIPIKTLRFKVRTKDEIKEDDKAEKESKKKLLKFYDEIRAILSYTNATPFKAKIGRLFCAYCSTEGPVFETPELLRSHTRTQHAQVRLKNVEMCMRPTYLNEILKMDIENLQCTDCNTPIDNWNEMFEHLKEKHQVELDAAYTKVIPFVLTEDISCCLCNQKFSHYHILDSHMNSHYNNYICGECGDTFLSESRLKKHVETHSTQRFPCQECGKVFTLDKYRRKHYFNVHLREQKFKCHYCKEKFVQEYTRHLHVVAAHKDKVKVISCEYCSATFTWRPYYLKHIRLNHTKPEKKHKCKLCDKRFYQKNELKNHEAWHIGEGYTCLICTKKFSSKSYLQKHSATHMKDNYIVVMNDDDDGGEVTIEDLQIPHSVA